MLIGAALGGAGAARADGGPPVLDLSIYARARAADGDGRAELAAAGYGRALSQAPDNVTVAKRAYREALEAGDDALIDRAQLVLQKSGDAPPDGALLVLASAVRDGNSDARDAALARISKGPFDFVLPALRAWIDFDAGKDAVASLDAKGNLLARRFNGENRALLLIASGRVNDGIIALQGLVGTDPASLDLRLNAAQLLAFQNRSDISQALLRGDDRTVAAYRSRLGIGVKPSAAFGISRLYLRLAADLAQGDPTPLSIALSRAALRLDPDSDRARLLLADALSKQDSTAGALAALDAIKPDSPLYALALDARVTVLNRGGEEARALAAAAVLSAAAGAGAAEATRLGGLLTAAKRHDEAAKAYALAIKRAGKQVNWAQYLQYGSALDQAGRWPEARKALQKAIELGPDEPVALNYLGYAQIERAENVPAARAMLERAGTLAPDNNSILDSLAWAYFLGGDVMRALPLLERASMADPANSEIAEHLGDAYWASGRRYEARYSWRAAAVAGDVSDMARLSAKIAGGPDPVRQRP